MDAHSLLQSTHCAKLKGTKGKLIINPKPILKLSNGVWFLLCPTKGWCHTSLFRFLFSGILFAPEYYELQCIML